METFLVDKIVNAVYYLNMVYEKSRQRRERKGVEILEAALELVGEHGLDGLTVSRVAGRMGWTKGALYRYYRSKDQLVAALNGHVLAELSAEMDAVLATLPDASPRTRLVAVLDRLVAISHERPAAFGLVSLTMADPRNLVENVEDATHIPVMFQLISRIVQLLAGAAEAGELAPGDPFARALRLVFATLGVIQLKKLARFDAIAFDARELARTTISDLLTAWEVP